MADLDDLLGDTPATTKGVPSGADNAAAKDDLDDLIGGDTPPPVKANVALDDDLFGDAPPSRSHHVDHSNSSTSSQPASPMVPKSRSRSIVPAQPLSLSPLSAAPSDKLKPFVASNTYFARFVSAFQMDRKRARQVISLTHSELLMTNVDMTVDRSVPISSIIGVMRQPVLVSKSFGFTKDYELQMIVQVEGERDVYFALNFDADNGSSTSSLDIIQVLSALCLSQGVALPVSDLRTEENIESMVKWNDGEDRVRRQFSEALAFRTELQNELQSLIRMDSQLSTSIETMKNSTATQAAADIHKEIDQIQAIMSEFAGRLEHIDRSKKETLKMLSVLQGDLQKEESRRASAVRETMEASSQAALMRQLAEYEIMKAAHKREMDKIAALTAMDERRVASRRGQTVYNNASQLSLRIDELEEEDSLISEKREEKAQHLQLLTVALAEAKKRLGLAKNSLTAATEEITAIRNWPSSEPLPAHVNVDPSPLYDPVVPSLNIHSAVAASKRAPPPPAAAAPQTATTPPPKAPIVLDLDEDDI